MGVLIKNITEQVLSWLAKLFAIHNFIEKFAAVLLSDGFVSGTDYEKLMHERRTLLNKLRPEMSKLVDGFDVPDLMVAPLGCFDGEKVYQKYMEVVKSGPQVKDGVPPYFGELIKPLLQSKEI